MRKKEVSASGGWVWNDHQGPRFLCGRTVCAMMYILPSEKKLMMQSKCLLEISVPKTFFWGWESCFPLTSKKNSSNPSHIHYEAQSPGSPRWITFLLVFSPSLPPLPFPLISPTSSNITSPYALSLPSFPKATSA